MPSTVSLRDIRRVLYSRPRKRRDHFTNALRLFVSALWTLGWGAARWVTGHPFPFHWRARVSPIPYRCESCHWVGALRWSNHIVVLDQSGEAEYVDECPRCCADALVPVRRKR